MVDLEDRNACIQRKKDVTRFGFGKMLLTVLLTGMIIILSSVVDFSQPLPAWRLPAAGAVVAMILIVSRYRIGKLSTQAMIMLFFWAGYATMSVSSAIASNDNIVGEFWQLLGVPYVIFLCIPHYAKQHGISMVALGVACGFLPYIVISLLTNPLHIEYEGIYSNPNAMGMVAAVWIIGLLILVRGYSLEGRRDLKKTVLSIGLVLLIGVGLVILVASGSRTSLITFAIIFFIFIWSLVLDSTKKRFYLTLAIAGVCLILLFMVASGGISAGGIFAGQMKKFDTGLGAVSGREVIWQTVLEKPAIFGYGNSNLEKRMGEPAHNTHMEVLHAKGYIGLVFRISFDIMAIVLAYQLARSQIKTNGYAVGPFMIVMMYMIMGLTENVNGTLGSGIHMGFLLMIGVLLNYHAYH